MTSTMKGMQGQSPRVSVIQDPLRLLLVLLILTWCNCVHCSAQTASTGKAMGEIMVGRDDAGSDRRPFLNTAYPEDQRPVFSSDRLGNWAKTYNIRSFGWLDGGFTSISSATGLVAEAPTPNRFSDQGMLNAAWLAVQRSTTESLSWGFRGDFYAGSDAALLRSLNHFGPDGSRWGTELRQAYFMLHTPIIFPRGIDWTIGRINIPTGTETVLSPYQQLYSRSYFWIHGETSGTVLFATLHASPKLDIVMGSTLGYNTTFLLRGRSPSYLARTICHPTSRRKQQFIATVYSGPEPLATASGHVGRWQTLAELQTRQAWTDRFSQIFEMNYIADVADPANGRHNSAAQDASILSAFIFNRKMTLHTRVEWFTDPHGSRATIPGTYGEATAGVNVHPNSWFEFRPEVRGDFSGQRSFGAAGSSLRLRNRLSIGFELLFKIRFF